jgi:hypothetical protein
VGSGGDGDLKGWYGDQRVRRVPQTVDSLREEGTGGRTVNGVGNQESGDLSAIRRRSRTRSRLVRLAVALAGAALLASGCGLFAPAVYQVTPAALADIRAIGMVRGEESSEVGYAESVEISNTFVIDVGGASAEEAVAKAARLLRDHGWNVLVENQTGVSMRSDKWDAYLTLVSFRPGDLAGHPAILRTLAGKSVRTDALVIIKVYPDQTG